MSRAHDQFVRILRNDARLHAIWAYYRRECPYRSETMLPRMMYEEMIVLLHRLLTVYEEQALQEIQRQAVLLPHVVDPQLLEDLKHWRPQDVGLAPLAQLLQEEWPPRGGLAAGEITYDELFKEEPPPPQE